MNSFSLLSANSVDNSRYVASSFRLLSSYVTSSIDMWVCNMYNVGTEIYYLHFLPRIFGCCKLFAAFLLALN
jgi:hypothetical protein